MSFSQGGAVAGLRGMSEAVVAAMAPTGLLAGPLAAVLAGGPPSAAATAVDAGAGRSSCPRTFPAGGRVVGMATTADGNGYWLVDQLGDVATFGDASCHGSLTGVRLDAPVVGMAADLTTGGYWLAARDGGVFSFGAPFRGSMGDVHLSAPVVAISALPDGRGYRLAGADGAVYDFGAARYYGRATGRAGIPTGPHRSS